MWCRRPTRRGSSAGSPPRRSRRSCWNRATTWRRWTTTRTGSSRRATRSSAGSRPVSARKGRPQVAEHDSDREDREPEEKGVPLDEEAAWAAIVAGYGEEPPDPPGTKPFKPIEDLALPDFEPNGVKD